MWSRWLERFWQRPTRGVDSHDVAAFPVAARRTWFLRMLLAGGAAALLLAAAVSARNLDTRERGLLPNGTVGVVVVDLSVSIADDDYRDVRRVLQRLIAEDARIGLVFFSDVPYELLPPGTPAAELKPMLRLLVAPPLGPPVNPWARVFRAGTRISPALQLAKEMIERDGVGNASILLVSDLETAPEDVPALVRTLDEIRRSSIALRVSALAPSSDARRIFAGFVQDGAFSLEQPRLESAEPAPATETTTALPVGFLVLGALFFLALAAYERFTGRLGLPVRPRKRMSA
jgi:hypothetical protein